MRHFTFFITSSLAPAPNWNTVQMSHANSVKETERLCSLFHQSKTSGLRQTYASWWIICCTGFILPLHPDSALCGHAIRGQERLRDCVEHERLTLLQAYCDAYSQKNGKLRLGRGRPFPEYVDVKMQRESTLRMTISATKNPREEEETLARRTKVCEHTRQRALWESLAD